MTKPEKTFLITGGTKESREEKYREIIEESACLKDEIKGLIETTVKVQTNRDSRFTIIIEGKAYPVSKRTKLIYSEITNPEQKTLKEILDSVKAIAAMESPTPSSGYKPLYDNADALMKDIVKKFLWCY